MTKTFLALTTILLFTPNALRAQDGDRASLAGPHIGIDIARESLEANQPGSSRDRDRTGVGGRINLGYDAVIGNIALVGAEIGVGMGGRTVTQASLAGGRYSIDPGLSYDVTGRIGIAPGGRFAVYGRGGYRWLRTEQTIAGQAAGNFSRKETERGFTYGAGIEYAVTPNVSLRTEFNRTVFSDNLRQNKVSLGAAFRF